MSSHCVALPIRDSPRAPTPPDFRRAGGDMAHAARTEAAWAANAVAAAAASRSTSASVTDTVCTMGGNGSNGARQSAPRRASATSAGIRADPYSEYRPWTSSPRSSAHRAPGSESADGALNVIKRAGDWACSPW